MLNTYAEMPDGLGAGKGPQTLRRAEIIQRMFPTYGNQLCGSPAVTEPMNAHREVTRQHLMCAAQAFAGAIMEYGADQSSGVDTALRLTQEAVWEALGRPL